MSFTPLYGFGRARPEGGGRRRARRVLPACLACAGRLGTFDRLGGSRFRFFLLSGFHCTQSKGRGRVSARFRAKRRRLACFRFLWFYRRTALPRRGRPGAPEGGEAGPRAGWAGAPAAAPPAFVRPAA